MPQGSVLSCCLFTLAIDGITADLPECVKCSLYVDDLMIYTTSSYLPSAERRLQRAINILNNWATNHGFTLSEDKTVVVNRKRSRAKPNLTLNGRMIVVRDSAKFLGMAFYERLTLKAHIRSLKTECIKKLAIIQCVSYTDWGADRTTMLRLYRAIVRSKLDHGAIVYASANKLLSSLDPVHNRAIRLCTGAFRSSPVQSLYAESGEPSTATIDAILYPY